MREGFRIRLVKDGGTLDVRPADEGAGLVVAGERDASPRDFSLEFSASSSVTALRMRHIQRLHGWHPWEFRLDVTVEGDGALTFRGGEQNSLPPGHYWIRPRIEDVRIERGKRVFFAIEEGGVTELELEVAFDPRRVELTRPMDEWDGEMERVLRSGQSTIDGRRPDEWLQRDDPRASRKACLLNILASLRSRPGEGTSLLEPLLDLFFVETDRIYARVSADLFRMLTDLVADPKMKFYDEGPPTAKIHRKLLDRARDRFGVDTGGFQLQSFRGEGGPSLQIVVGIPPGVAAEHFAEMDLDLGNPLEDVKGFIVHIGELLDIGRTDHLSLRAKLAKTEAKEFLYYRVRKT